MDDTENELVSCIYSALLGEMAWQDFMLRFTAVADVECATLFFHDAGSGRGGVTLAAGIPESAQQEYASHFGRLNPWMWQVGQAPIGTAILGEQLVARDRFQRTEYYNDFLQRYDQETGVGVTIERSDGRFLLMSTLSGDTNEDRNLRRARLLTGLAPHLRRVADFYRRHRLEGLGADLPAHLLDRSGLAVVLVDAVGRMVFASPGAEDMLATGSPAFLGRNGFLRFLDSDHQAALSRMLEDGAAAPPLTLLHDEVEITMLPVARDAAASHFNGRSVALVFARQPDRAQGLARRFLLTRAETRVTRQILAGHRPRDIAQASGVSIETVRTQLKAVFAKTGAQGQADLVRLAAGMERDRHDHA